MDVSVDLETITFEAAIEQTTARPRFLLLGNGFSIAARRGSFSFPSLLSRAGPFSEPVVALFEELETADFEQVLGALKRKLADPNATPSDREEWKRQEQEVRAGFIGALQRVHPESAAMMGHDECQRCVTFLKHFVGGGRGLKLDGRVYTTNYDLLLYWVVVRGGRGFNCFDRHYTVRDDPRYALWDSELAPGLVYLHGALHTYDRPDGGQMMLRYDGRLSLIDQARRRLDQGEFPVFVAEGTTEDKVSRIARSRYLTWARRYLGSGMNHREGALFTYGHSLSDRDAHLLRVIGEKKIREVYVGAFGGLRADNIADIRMWVARWREARAASGFPLDVWVFDTKLYSPWS